MGLRGLMSALGMNFFAVAGLLVSFAAFVAILVWLWTRPRNEIEAQAEGVDRKGRNGRVVNNSDEGFSRDNAERVFFQYLGQVDKKLMLGATITPAYRDRPAVCRPDRLETAKKGRVFRILEVEVRRESSTAITTVFRPEYMSPRDVAVHLFLNTPRKALR